VGCRVAAEPTLVFMVRGEPKPQPRPRAQVRAGRAGGRAMAHIYTPSTGCERWRAGVAAACRLEHRGEPLLCGLRVRIRIYLPRTKALCRLSAPDEALPMTVAGKGDVDNFAKAILDAVEGILFKNDAQVWSLTVSKQYVARGCSPGAVVSVWVDEGVRDV